MNWYWKYNRFLKVDLAISLLLSAILVVAKNYGWIEKLQLERDLIIAAVGLFGSLLGFIIATLAVMVGLLNEKSATLLKKAGHSETIIGAYRSTLLFLGLATILLLSQLIFASGSITNIYIVGLTLFLTFACAFRLQKSIWLLVRTLHVLRR